MQISRCSEHTALLRTCTSQGSVSVAADCHLLPPIFGRWSRAPIRRCPYAACSSPHTVHVRQWFPIRHCLPFLYHIHSFLSPSVTAPHMLWSYFTTTLCLCHPSTTSIIQALSSPASPSCLLEVIVCLGSFQRTPGAVWPDMPSTVSVIGSRSSPAQSMLDL
jgi:hypothetical protein